MNNKQRSFNGRTGMTMIELLLSVVILSAVFAGAANVYISCLNFFEAMEDNNRQVEAYIAQEHIVRKIHVANRVVVMNDAGVPQLSPMTGTQLKIRWDRNAARDPNETTTAGAFPFTYSGTTFNTADDHWIKYAFVPINGAPNTFALRWRQDAVGSANENVLVTANDPELDPGRIYQLNSFFWLRDPKTVCIQLRTDMRTQRGALARIVVIKAEATAHAQSI